MTTTDTLISELAALRLIEAALDGVPVLIPAEQLAGALDVLAGYAAASALDRAKREGTDARAEVAEQIAARRIAIAAASEGEDAHA